jgi:membrane protein YdbS with pleckstrin-like domain
MRLNMSSSLVVAVVALMLLVVVVLVVIAPMLRVKTLGVGLLANQR